ncbi:MAG: hypothetical protein ACREU6_16860, partial [Steroidobacteraceae bacterium]
APLPIKIEQYDDKVVFHYEFFNSTRTVYMDGRPHPSNLKPSRLGHSIGWYDGDTLVIDTVGIEPHLVKYPAAVPDGILASSHARGIERYTRSKDGNSLNLEMTLIDPWTLKQPLVLERPFLYGPHETLQHDDCQVNPAYLKAESAPK